MSLTCLVPRSGEIAKLVFACIGCGARMTRSMTFRVGHLIWPPMRLMRGRKENSPPKGLHPGRPRPLRRHALFLWGPQMAQRASQPLPPDPLRPHPRHHPFETASKACSPARPHADAQSSTAATLPSCPRAYCQRHGSRAPSMAVCLGRQMRIGAQSSMSALSSGNRAPILILAAS